VLIGDNAQGKTSLLEAIYYLATSRRCTRPASQLINWLAKKDNLLLRPHHGARRPHGCRAHARRDAGARAGAQRRGTLSQTNPAGRIPRQAKEMVGQMAVVLFCADVELIGGGLRLGGITWIRRSAR